MSAVLKRGHEASGVISVNHWGLTIFPSLLLLSSPLIPPFLIYLLLSPFISLPAFKRRAP